MSWLFGYKKPVVDLPIQGASDGSSPGGGGGGNDKPPTGNVDPKAFGGHQSVYKFDSTALERAAQAAKELERSRTYYEHSIVDLNRKLFTLFSLCKSSI